MSPIREIKPIDPSNVDWQDWKTGGGSKETSAIIDQVVNQVYDAILKQGAARLCIDGKDPAFGGPQNEANYWSLTLRRRFRESGTPIKTLTKDQEDGSVNLYITYR